MICWSSGVKKLFPLSFLYDIYCFFHYLHLLIYFFPSPVFLLFLLFLLPCFSASPFEGKIVTPCLNSLTRLAQWDLEYCLTGLEYFPSTLLLETMEMLWLSSCKQYLPQAYGHVLFWVLPSGAVPVLCKEEQDVIGKGLSIQFKPEVVEEMNHLEILSGCPALLRFRKDSFLLLPIFIVSQERIYWISLICQPYTGTLYI